MSAPEISEQAWARFRALVDASSDQETTQDVFARFIQEVSDAAKAASEQFSAHAASAPCIKAKGILAPFILPDPDPLADALKATLPITLRDWTPEMVDSHVAYLRAELAKRGLEIREVKS